MRKIREFFRKRQVLNFLVILAAVAFLLPLVQDLILALRPDDKGAEETVYRVIVQDDAQLLSASERESLRKQMSQSGVRCDLAFVTVPAGSDNPETSPETVYKKLFGKGNAILFQIDMARRKITVQKSNWNSVLTTAKCDSITDNVYRYASAGNYYRCASSAFQQIRSVMGGKEIPQPMQHLSNALIALGAALFVLFVPAGKTGVKPPHKVYDLDDSFHADLQVKKLKKTLVRTIQPSDSSSSDGGSRGGGGISFGGGGGGFSSGGGGGSGSSGGSHGF